MLSKIGIVLITLLIKFEGFNFHVLPANSRYCQIRKKPTNYMKELLQNVFPYTRIEFPLKAKKHFSSTICSGQGLTFVPTDVIPKDTEFLDLSRNNLRSIG